MGNPTSAPGQTTVDPAEIERFSRIAAEWWDPAGKFAPLHRLNPEEWKQVRRDAGADDLFRLVCNHQRLGYGIEGCGLILNLVFNPGGAFLPPSQKALEADYKREMQKRYGISFNNLFTITNLPVGRFLAYLNSSGNFEMYMGKLVASYNPSAATNVMCRNILSVGWDGTLYDCDFNQMLGLSVNHGAPTHLKEFDLSSLSNRQIVTGIHCYGCTAGAGSSCGGATT